MKNNELVNKLKENIRKLKDFPKKYKIIVKPIESKNISFEQFRKKEVLEWCKLCGKGKICGRCPSKRNNFNKEHKKIIKNSKKGILLVIKVPSKELAGKKACKENLPSPSQRLVNQSLREIKKELKKVGYKKFNLFAAGPCKLAYCYDKNCLMIKEGKCRYPTLSNQILECSGVNVFKTSKNVGHKIYYIDRNTNPKEVPYGSRVGLILYK